MRELKAGFGLVFGTLIGWLDFIFILLIWLILIFASSSINARELPKIGLFTVVFYMYIWPLSMGTSPLATGYRNVLSCGGLYCVPRLTKGMKRFAVIAGFFLAFMFSIPWILIKDLTPKETYICVSLSFTLLAAFSIGIGVFNFATSNYFLRWIVWFVQMVVIIRLLLAIYPGISILDGWPALLAAGVFLNVVYCWSYNNRLIQNLHRQLASSSTDISEKPQQSKMQITSNVEQFFIGRLNHCSQKAKYLWGAIYPCLGTLLSSSRKMLFIVFALIIVSCFMPGPPSIIIVFSIITIVISGTATYIKLPVCSQMLTAGGRRERFYGTLATAIGFSVIIGLIFAVLTGISWLTVPFIPQFVFKGETITFTPFTLYPVFIIMGLIPLIFGLGLCHERARYLTDFIVIVIAVTAFTLINSVSLMEIDTIVKILSTTIFVISCWIFLIITSGLICYRKDLILQTDTT